jgi:hypothetical protein
MDKQYTMRCKYRYKYLSYNVIWTSLSNPKEEQIKEYN